MECRSLLVLRPSQEASQCVLKINLKSGLQMSVNGYVLLKDLQPEELIPGTSPPAINLEGASFEIFAPKVL